ncbi:hypothetical protein [Streptomyces sp. NPDC001502]|uniref:hypothetical protein n=1 Tax=Streptomyces sp. NPDC001502 TaxID=3364578 RepID=UPI00368C94D8
MRRGVPGWRRLRLLGTARLRLALVMAAIAATAITMLTSLPALAEPTPSPSSSIAEPTPSPSPSTGTGLPPVVGERTPTPEEIKEMEELLAELNERISEDLQDAFLNAGAEQIRKQLPNEGGIMAVFDVTDRNGVPISVYSAKTGTGTGTWTDWGPGISDYFADMFFMCVKWAIAFCCWLIGWSLSFGLAKLLLTPVASAASGLHVQVILQMGLPSLFLAVCGLITVARILFGDRAKGWGDAALSLLLAALTTTLLASPPDTLIGPEDSALAVTRGMALEVADIILDAKPHKTEDDRRDAAKEDSVSPTSLSRPFKNELTDAFVVKPAMLLQYGRVFKGDCAKKYADTKISQIAYDRQVAKFVDKLRKANQLQAAWNPFGAVMTEAVLWAKAEKLAAARLGISPVARFEKECVSGDAEAVKRATIDKVGGALFLLIAALIVTVLICGLSGSFLLAQCRIAWDAVRAEPALVAGLVPGAGRAFLWNVCTSILHSLGKLFVSVIGLAVLILIIQAVLDPGQQDEACKDLADAGCMARPGDLTFRFLVVDILCIGAVMKRKALAARSQRVANNLLAKLSASRIGGTDGSIFTPAATPIPKNRTIVRTTARGAVRTAMVGISLPTNPAAAVAYAASTKVNPTADLMKRLKPKGAP